MRYPDYCGTLLPMADEVQENDSKETTVYEVGFHLVPGLDEEGVAKEIAALKDVLQKSGATVLREGTPEMRSLAYTMEKMIDNAYQRFDSAYFDWIVFETEPANVLDVKQWLDENISVLRFIIVKTTREEPVKERPVLREKKVTTPETIATPRVEEKSEEVSEEELEKSIEKIVS